jgi:hypothetical protein
MIIIFIAQGLRSGKYSLIASAAGNIWKKMGNNQKSCEELLSQMRKYKLRLEPYNEVIRDSDETPMLWWLAVDDTSNYLQELALYVLSVVPHSASCERVFSILRWFYGKRRLSLQTSKVESMAKIRSYYVSKANDELKYASSKYSKDELKVMVDESLDNLEEDFEDSEPERILVEPDEIPNHTVSVLILEEIFDVDKVPFIRDLEDSDDEEDDDDIDDNDDNNNDDVPEEEPVEDYDVSELASRFLD